MYGSITKIAFSETTKFWSLNRNWATASGPIATLGYRWYDKGWDAIVSDWTTTIVVAIIGFVIAWVGTLLINLLRAPILVGREHAIKLSELKQSKESAVTEAQGLLGLLQKDRPELALVYSYIHGRNDPPVPIGIRNTSTSLSARGITIDPIGLVRQWVIRFTGPDTLGPGEQGYIHGTFSIDGDLERSDLYEALRVLANAKTIGPTFRSPLDVRYCDSSNQRFFVAHCELVFVKDKSLEVANKSIEETTPQVIAAGSAQGIHPRGEIVTLACGHKLLIQHHRINAFLCEACVEDHQRKPRGPQQPAGGDA